MLRRGAGVAYNLLMPELTWRGRAAAFLLLSALAIAWAMYPLAPRSIDLPPRIASGEALLHGIEYWPVSETMPLSSTASAVVRHHLPRPWRDLIPRLILLASVALVFLLGALLHSPFCGGLAAALAAIVCWSELLDNLEQGLYGLLLLLLACLLAPRARRPGRSRSVAAGLGLGLTFLVRSPLLLFAPLLTCWELCRGRGVPLRERLHRLAPLWLIPALLLLPWLWMNWSVHQRIVPFEMARADESVVAGALGWMSTVKRGDVFAAAGVPEGADPVRWAVLEMARHPLRTVSGISARAFHAAGLHPWLFLLALLGLLLRRRDEAVLQTGLLAACYFGTHCLMGTVPRYFEPVWPLLSVLASVPAAGLIVPASPEERLETPVRWVLGVLSVPAALSLLFVLLYPLRVSGDLRELREALAANLRDPFLWTESGKRHLQAGRAEEAVKDFKMALLLDPHDSRRLTLARGLLAAGDPQARALDRLSFRNPIFRPEAGIARGLLALRRGQVPEGRELLEESRRAWDEGCRLLWTTGRAGEKEARESLCAHRRGWEESALSMLDPLSDEDFGRMVSLMGGVSPEQALRFLETASVSLDLKNEPEAARILRRVRAGAPGLGLEPGLRLAGLLKRAGLTHEAAEWTRSLAGRFPASGEAAVRAAEAAAAGGRIGDARRALRRAAALDLSAYQLRSAVAAAERVEETGVAARLLKRLTARAPRDFEAWFSRADAALRRGDCVDAKGSVLAAGAAAGEPHAAGRVDQLAQRLRSSCP